MTSFRTTPELVVQLCIDKISKHVNQVWSMADHLSSVCIAAAPFRLDWSDMVSLKYPFMHVRCCDVIIYTSWLTIQQ